jgi:hypothetical protein
MLVRNGVHCSAITAESAARGRCTHATHAERAARRMACVACVDGAGCHGQVAVHTLRSVHENPTGENDMPFDGLNVGPRLRSAQMVALCWLRRWQQFPTSAVRACILAHAVARWRPGSGEGPRSFSPRLCAGRSDDDGKNAHERGHAKTLAKHPELSGRGAPRRTAAPFIERRPL